MEKINTVAFDLGGVLAYRDLSCLTEEEKKLLEVYMNRNCIQDEELVRYATSRMSEIFIKMYKLRKDTIPTLDMLKEERITPSIWTNNVKMIDDWFSAVGLYRYIRREDIVNSFYISTDKPNLEFYRRALEIIKKHRNQVLFIDDNKRNVEGAEVLGIPSLVYHEEDTLSEVVQDELRRKRL